MPEKPTKQIAVRFPKNVIRDLNNYVKRGRRSEFIVNATEKALLQLKQAKALDKAKGVFNETEYPNFLTPEDTKAWVAKIRQEADRRLKEFYEK